MQAETFQVGHSISTLEQYVLIDNDVQKKYIAFPKNQTTTNKIFYMPWLY